MKTYKKIPNLTIYHNYHEILHFLLKSYNSSQLWLLWNLTKNLENLQFNSCEILQKSPNNFGFLLISIWPIHSNIYEILQKISKSYTHNSCEILQKYARKYSENAPHPRHHENTPKVQIAHAATKIQRKCTSSTPPRKYNENATSTYRDNFWRVI